MNKCVPLSPDADPCLYIMRFANKLEFGDKAHEVSMTAQRLVQRMMKDSIHSGRRPSGLCGAALLIAARMHEYNRTPMDIVRIVKIHESTLRKRLIEFGDTPSSLLTLDEFMAVDLEAEQDPPAFKAARKKDRERLQKITDSVAEFTELQQQIDTHLEKDNKRTGVRKRQRTNTSNTTGVALAVVDPSATGVADFEGEETDVFIRECTLDIIKECIGGGRGDGVEREDGDDDDNDRNVDENCVKRKCASRLEPVHELRPDIAAMCVPSVRTMAEESATASANFGDSRDETNGEDMGSKTTAGNVAVVADDGELSISDLDDDEINGYIMTENEANYKLEMWNKLNSEYLVEMQQREERLAREKEEGKPEKKKRRAPRKRHIGPSNTAGEAIEKMLQEKKISNKINYDILRTLTEPKTDGLAPTAGIPADDSADAKWSVE